MDYKDNLFGKTINELKIIVAEAGIPSYTAIQLAEWIYKKSVRSFGQMSNISKSTRNLLSERYIIESREHINFVESADGTKKYLYPAGKNLNVETVYIPEKKRDTICISTQAGCRMGCHFCMTGRNSFEGNLISGEILNQFSSLPEKDKITNIVYMGMGEPFDNFKEVMKSIEILTSGYGYGISPKRITVSTIGIKNTTGLFLNKSDCHLAVSLHSPFDDERQLLMPVEKSNPVKQVIDEIKSCNIGKQRRVSFEYILFKGINDTPKHIAGLSKLLNGLRCRINLIKFHSIPGTDFESPDKEKFTEFRDGLTKKGFITTIRQSRGEDIFAACGMLSTKNPSR